LNNFFWINSSRRPGSFPASQCSERRAALSDEWPAQLPQIDARHRERVAELAKQIENTEGALTQRVAEFALAGVAPKIVAQATAKIQATLDSLHHEHEVAERRSKTCDLREQQVRDMERLLPAMRENTRGLSMVERRAIVELLDIWVYPDTTDFRRRGGVSCAVTDWRRRTVRPCRLTPQKPSGALCGIF
jgi:hypothetical protein